MSAVLALLLAAPDSLAQGNAQKQALARALFDQGRELMEKGNPQAACPKFEDSQKLDPGIGTTFHLAHCYEVVGKTASAWSLFLEVAAQARASNQTDRESAARERAKALEPNVSKLTITVPSEVQVAGMQVKLDNVEVGRAGWGAAMPTDPGKHTIEVLAPGKKTSSAQVVVEPGGKSASFTVPALEDAASSQPLPAGSASSDLPVASQSPPPPPPPTPLTTQAQPPWPPPENRDGSTQRYVGLAVGGAGVVGLAVSGILALGAKSRYDEAAPNCAGNTCDQTGQDIHDEARSRGNVATVVGAIGLVAIAGGAVLFFTAPSRPSQPSAARASTWMAAGPGSLALGGSW